MYMISEQCRNPKRQKMRYIRNLKAVTVIILHIAFKRGEVCWAAPYGHIVWVDDDGIPYDISGVDDSDTNDYIPEFMMESTVKDFRHVPGVVNNTTDQKIAQMVLDWHDIKSEMFGGDVTKLSLKEANKFVKSFTIYEEDFGGIYQKKEKIFKKKIQNQGGQK